MKKCRYVVLACVLILSLTACNQQTQTVVSSLDEPNNSFSSSEPANQSLARQWKEQRMNAQLNIIRPVNTMTWMLICGVSIFIQS